MPGTRGPRAIIAASPSPSDAVDRWDWSRRRRLVHRLACSWHMAAGQLAVFQGASEAPIPTHFCLLLVWPFRSRRKNGAGRVERATRKNSQLTSGPEGCLENGPAAALLVGYVSIQICALLAPCRRPILNPTICQLHMRPRTSGQLQENS